MILARLRRHPFAVEAFFRHSLVLTYAYPEEVLRPLLPPGLVLDDYEGWAFLAIALVQTEGLRPAGWPRAFGRDFFLSGYRIFSRYRRPDGTVLRGLRILRSDADKGSMVFWGNLLTHYGYRKCEVKTTRGGLTLDVAVTTSGAEADLSVRAFIGRPADAPPPGSPFPDLQVARKFAGPLPYTFDYEPESKKMVIVQGVRSHWNPKPVEVEVTRASFLEKPPFSAHPARLANAFFLESIPYHWKRGVVEPVSDGGA